MSSPLPSPDVLRQECQPFLDQIRTLEDVEAARLKLFGRKGGLLTEALKRLGGASLDEKKTFGPQYNALKAQLEGQLKEAEAKYAAAERARALEQQTIDITLPGSPRSAGHLHPLSQVMTEIVGIFRRLGFVCADGPEIESEFFNFEALNVPADHPARDMQDTFYIAPAAGQATQQYLFSDHRPPSQEPTLLRTHTSPVQVHVMKQYPPPLAIVCPGRVYRHEAVDASHAAVFHQLEGLLVDEGVSFSDLKGTLSRFAQSFFGAQTRTRFRPSFFPFTEPSAEMDVTCSLCAGSGCRTCKNTGWIELMGSGMVNPNVFAAVGIDVERYTGFAFGMGIERLAMIKYGVDDMRLFFENDVRFLKQF